MNVIELHRKTDQSCDVLEAMLVGIELSKHQTLAQLAAFVANAAPLEYLRMLSRLIEPPNKD